MRAALAMVLLAAGCDVVAASSSPPMAQRIAALEKRVAELEIAKVAATDAKDDRRVGFSDCVAGAEEVYWRYIQLNGRKKRGSDPANPVWIAPMFVWNQAAVDKRNAIDVCKATWKKGD